MRGFLTCGLIAIGLTLGCASAEPQGTHRFRAETFRLAGTRRSADCAIRIDGVVQACRRSERPARGEMLASFGLYGWPRRGIDGLSCSDALCLAADDHRVDFYSAKGFPPVRFRRVVVVRENGDVVAIALSSRNEGDRAWRGMVDSGLDPRDRKRAISHLRTFFTRGRP